MANENTGVPRCQGSGNPPVTCGESAGNEVGGPGTAVKAIERCGFVACLSYAHPDH